MLRGCTLVTALVLAVAVLWGAPVSAHPALEVRAALEAQADLPVATKSPALAWSSAPTPPALPWPVVLAVAVVSIAAWRRPRRALALAIVLILGSLAFENGVHGGRSFQRAGLVHADRWKINACPHRGAASRWTTAVVSTWRGTPRRPMDRRGCSSPPAATAAGSARRSD